MKEFSTINKQHLKLIHWLHFLLLILICDTAGAQSLYLFGNIHSHSEYSDGNQGNDPAYSDVASCFEYIRQNTLHVNYWGISDHNHSSAGMNLPDYHKGVHQADSMNEDGVFAAMYGMEWGVISSGGHIVVYGFDSLIGWDNGNYDIYNGEFDYNGLFTKIAARGDGAFAYLAHMDATDYGNLLSVPYNAIWDSAIVGLALRNGPAFSTDTTYGSLPTYNYFDRYRDLLRKGYHVAPGIDHDNHYIVFGRTHPGRTVVIADSLNRSSIMQAFRKRRFYASDDWNARVHFSLNGFTMGSICSGTVDPIIHVDVQDPDNEFISNIKIWFGIPGNGITATPLTQINNNDSLNYTHVLPIGSTYYYFAEITQSDGDKIWTAPVWFTRNDPPPTMELLNFTAKRVGDYATLNWSTANEFNLDRYDIEKSYDSFLFSVTGQMSPTGSIGNIASYNWTDSDILDTTTFYRLDIYDFSGASTQSEIRRVDPYKTGLTISLNPNLAGSQQISIFLTNNFEEPIKMDIFSETGQLVLSSAFYTTKGTIEVPVTTGHLSRGLYLIRFTNPDNKLIKTQRFIRH